MAEWFKNYWYLVIIFVIVCAVTAVIMYFAARAYSRHRRDYRNQEKEIKRLLELKEKYQTLTEDAIMSADENELLEGTALSYQLVLQKIDDNEAAFEEMSDCKKDIYTLDVFVHDASVKTFFSENGDILRKRLVGALERIGMKEFSDEINFIALMFDDKDETVSYSVSEMEKFDEQMLERDILTQIKLKSAVYIKNNCDSFIN